MSQFFFQNYSREKIGPFNFGLRSAVLPFPPPPCNKPDNSFFVSVFRPFADITSSELGKYESLDLALFVSLPRLF